MTQNFFQYWEPGETYRRIRIFFSHRYGDDERLYEETLERLRLTGYAVQDLSLTEDQKIQGPRAGKVSELRISREISARIYSSDILIAPSSKAIAGSDWISWEIELASICYNVPVLFVDRRPDVKRRTSLLSELRDAGAKVDCAEPNALSIANSLARLAGSSYRAVSFEEADERSLFRGPLRPTLHQVMKRFPYQPRD